jgi:signal peptidase I
MDRHTEGQEISERQQKEEGQQLVEGQEISERQQMYEGQQASEGQQAPKEPKVMEQQKAGETPLHTIAAFFVKLGIVCLALWSIFTFVFGIRQMHGETMYPRLRDGDLILYNRMERNYAIGDVVVFKVGTSTCVARIVAQGGDVVDVDDKGDLLVNGNIQEEEIFYETEADPLGVSYPYTVDEDSYFMLSDFRTNTTDSRSFGAVSVNDFCGKVITILRRRGI